MAGHGYDTIVIGLGAMGAATLMQLARRGQRVLGIDRYDPPHTRGSTHGDTRVTRLAIGEGDQYVALAQRSHAIWRALEAETGEALLTQSGVLIMGVPDAGPLHGKPDFLGTTIAVARRHGIGHEVLTPAEVAARWPQFRLTGNETAYFEPEGGYVRPERCVAVQLRLARQAGAEIRTGTRVTGIRRDGGGLRIETDAGVVFAAEAVLAAGAWSPGLLGGEWAPRMRVLRQTVHWFAPEDAAAFTPERFPVFIWAFGARAEDSMYGFPIPPGGTAVKLGSEQYDVTGDPDTIDRHVTPAESAEAYRTLVQGRLNGVSPTVEAASACLYTFTPDGDFLIGRAPENDRVLLVSACSGHGFKHSAALGERVAAGVSKGAVP